ncbi:MAG: putative Ig domain-containing protein, partial [Nitrospira sp.]
SWTVVSGALPVGVTLSPSGLLSGTPTTQGTSTFTILVQDSGTPPQSNQQSFSLTINAVTPVSGTLTKTTAVLGVDATFVTNAQLTLTEVQVSSIVISWGEGPLSNPLEGMDVVVESTGATSVLFATRSDLGTGLWFCSVNFPCQGLTVDRSAGTATFVNTVVVLNPFIQSRIVLNGTLTFPPF